MAEKIDHDIVIIGAGPAGLTAAIYSAWLGLRTIVLETGIVGGRAWMAPRIDNFPGFPEGIKGSDLIQRMSQQAKQFNAEFRDDEEVVGLDFNGEAKKVITRKKSYTAQVVIIATGTQRRKLHVPGEADFLGRGVSYCATCDGPFFRGKPVAIVGNDEEAAIDALALADFASKVTIVSQEPYLSIEGKLMDRLHDKLSVEILKGKVIQITGDTIVRSLMIEEFISKRQVMLEVKGVFVSIGGVPLTAIVKNAGVVTDRGGCLSVDRQQKTNIRGIFAAGDCTCGGMQIVTAAGEGAMAAMKASSYIRKGSD